MKHALHLVAGALSLLLVLAAALPAQRYTFQTSDEAITVSGTSSLHDWTCTVDRFEGWMEEASPSGPSGGEIVGRVSIPADAIECGKGLMNRKLRAAINSKEHEWIVFEAASLEPTEEGLVAAGVLRIAGSSHSLNVPVRVSGSESLQLVGSVDLSLDALGIPAPTALMRSIKTGDVITVAFNVTAAPGQ